MFCSDISAPLWFLFSQGVPPILYYSHFFVIVASLIIGFFVYFQNQDFLAGKLLLLNAIFLSLWSLVDVILWANIDSKVIMFFWSFINVLEMLVSLTALYFAYVFLEKKDVSALYKFIGAVLFLPYLLFSFSQLNLTMFDLVNCEPIQGPMLYYFYFFEGLLGVWLIGYLLKKIITTDKRDKQMVILFSLGLITFLVSFSVSNVVASVTQYWKILYFGLFGAPFFLALLAYLIVRYKAFDIKLIGAQALVVAQFILIGSMLTVVTSTLNYILVSVTLILTLGAGWILIRSVRREIERKEELQKISDALAIANQRLKDLDMAKSEFISIASHQLRTPLTAIKGYVSLLLEGSYGKVPAPIQDVLDKLYTINNRLVQLVEDLLNISRIEAGRIQYNFAPTQIEPLVAELADMFALTAKSKQLTLKINLPKQGLPKLAVDPNKIKEVVSNLIDNALKYTKEGGVTVAVEADERAVRIIVSDTGIGIHPEEKNKLFEKFIRTKETTKLFVSGTGLGLYVGKNFVEAHGGKIWAESEGHDKGSRFIVELPFMNPRVKEGISDQVSSLGRGK